MSRYRDIALLAAVLTLLACGGQPGPAPLDDSQSPRQLAESQSGEPRSQGPQDDRQAAAALDAETASAAAPAGPSELSQQLYEQAVTALKKDDAELAIDLLLTVSSEAPDKPFVFTNLGLAHFRLQQYDLALSAFQQAVSHDAGDAVAYNHLGILQRRQGQFEAARESYQRALEIDSDYALAHLNLGILFDIYLQNLEPALRHYQRYQALLDEENETVSGWIADLERRLKSAAS
jgi:tetratricopeptide (TPR) repeat protein